MRGYVNAVIGMYAVTAAAAAAFLERSAALTVDPARRAARTLAAAQDVKTAAAGLDSRVQDILALRTPAGKPPADPRFATITQGGVGDTRISSILRTASMCSANTSSQSMTEASLELPR